MMRPERSAGGHPPEGAAVIAKEPDADHQPHHNDDGAG